MSLRSRLNLVIVQALIISLMLALIYIRSRYLISRLLMYIN
jgi:hypothetical protein